MSYDQPRNDPRDYAGRGRGRPGGGGGHERRGIPLSDLDPTLTSISHKVIGCARDVHVALGPGYDRAVYSEALKHEMTANGVNFTVGASFPVAYKGQRVGHATADLFIENRFLVDILAVPGEVGTHERMSLRGALKAADLELGLIINFAGRLLKDGLVRVLNVDKINAARGVPAGEGHDDEGRAHEFET